MEIAVGVHGSLSEQITWSTEALKSLSLIIIHKYICEWNAIKHFTVTYNGPEI